MELDSIPVFVKVAQLGSFTKASAALGMPNTTVSAKVAQLERHLGVTLIQRTTRKLNLTEAGTAYLARAIRALNELKAAESEVQNTSQEISGTLRITASVDVGQSLLAPMVAEVQKLHPKLKIELLITNRRVDLVGESVDVGIRAGAMKDSSMIAKKFFDVRFTLWASKEYLKKNGTPKDLKDLSKHTFIKFSQLKDGAEFTNGKTTSMIRPEGPVTADDLGAVKSLAEFGLGLAMLPSFLCEKDPNLNLVRVLPDWGGAGAKFALVYPAQQFVTPKVRAFIEVAERVFKSC